MFATAPFAVAGPLWSIALSLKSLPAALKTAALSLGLLLQAPVHAGLISGSWDPEFGTALPGLSWAAYAELSASDACTAAVGNQTVGIGSGGPCADAKLNAVFLQLYDNEWFGALDWSSDSSYNSLPPHSATFAICDTALIGDSRCGGNFWNYFSLSALRIEGGSVVGLQATVNTSFLAEDPGTGTDPWPSSSMGKLFKLNFMLEGPELYCQDCTGGPIKSSSEGLRQFLVTYKDNGQAKFTDSTGKALGVVLDDKGQVLGRATSINAQFVPEPGGLALVLAALGAAALARRRRGLPATAARRHAP